MKAFVPLLAGLLGMSRGQPSASFADINPDSNDRCTFSMDLYPSRSCLDSPTPLLAFDDVPINHCIRSSLISGGRSFRVSNCRIGGEIAIGVYDDAYCERPLGGGYIGALDCADRGCCTYQLPYDTDFDGTNDDSSNVFFSIDITG